MWRRILKWGWAGLLTVSMIITLLNGRLVAESITTVSNISPLIVIQDLVLIVAVIGTYEGVIKLAPFMNWSWLSLFSHADEDTGALVREEGTNLNVVPIEIPWFGLFFCALLLANVPYYAYLEETWFREGLNTWREGVAWSLIFGFVHCLIGVPIGMGLAISIAGLWFTHEYFVGGIPLSTAYHTAYNFILLGTIFAVLLIVHFAPIKSKRKRQRKRRYKRRHA